MNPARGEPRRWGKLRRIGIAAFAVVHGCDQPQRVPTIGRVREVSTSAQHTCAVGDVGGVWCWGAGGYVGRGGKIDQLVPSGPAAVHDRPGVP